MKKWIKRICIALCVIAASMTIFDRIDSKKETTDETNGTEQVQVVD